jgi:hypothetical protein
MKKFFLAAVAAFVVAGLVFVACKKEETNIDKVANEQVVKHQKTEGVPIVEIPEVFYSSDGITFFDENGTAVTGIHVNFEEANQHATLATENGNQHIVSCNNSGNTCGHATVSDDVTTMSWGARYAICSDGRIIIERDMY